MEIKKKKKSIENYNFQSSRCCILLFYNSQPYIVDPYIAAYFGYLMIHNHYSNISREVKTVYFTMVPRNYP